MNGNVFSLTSKRARRVSAVGGAWAPRWTPPSGVVWTFSQDLIRWILNIIPMNSSNCDTFG